VSGYISNSFALVVDDLRFTDGISRHLRGFELVLRPPVGSSQRFGKSHITSYYCLPDDPQPRSPGRMLTGQVACQLR
jgi:hypothetical protein